MNLHQIAIKVCAHLESAGPFQLTEAVFLRLLGFIYIISFASFLPQINGLIGAHGIVSVTRLMDAIRPQGVRAFLNFPTLLWFGANDQMLTALCITGCVAGLVLVSGFFSRVAAALCWIFYLSMVSAAQPFSNFQWDALLLECGFLALFAGVPLTGYAYRFLLFRLMFESGLVKLSSHDPNWRNLHALRFHFLTQPLPTPLAYYAYRLPGWMLDGMTASTLFIELAVPFLLFGPRVARRIAVGLFMFLQVLILLTGNYAFFNLLTLALCFWGLDDRTFAPLGTLLKRHALTLKNRAARQVATASAGILILIAAIQLAGMLAPVITLPVLPVIEAISPFDVVNNYGLFAQMTTTRIELVIEGSDDQANWREYQFRYKPGDLHRELPVVAPYQPRLDWQMWFAALGSYNDNTWVGGVIYALLTGSPGVEKLMATIPFTRPPKFIRILAYDYEFTTPEQRAKTGAVWERRFLGKWFGPVSLRQ